MNDFWIILTAVLVACSCSLLGCFLVLRRMAMIGDAISHSVLPGIVIAFLISGSKDSLFMMIGAAVFGLITVYLIQWFHQNGVQSDAAIGVVFTALFAVGVVLVSLYSRQVHLDLDHVLFGEIMFVPWERWMVGEIDLGPKAVWVLGFVLTLSSLLIGLFYKQFKICAFDPAMAAAAGIPVALFHYLLMGLVSVTTVASFESVGAILVVGLLVVPAATAYLLTERLSRMIFYSMGIGALSAVSGYYISVLLDASIAGCMITMAGILFVVALLFSPTHGVVWRKLRQKRLSREEAA
ncbi:MULTISPECIES: metal ABC transporter permease [unclassified Paenibacillus]|uniref:metal ABC transporter permease n=1 Tax=unclassified Paenibacillus TaxID=185978 RepID=UPI001AE1145A|nr:MULTISPECIES: metal ABC transporter permease [unclassified Paenibacillus]MBP1154347.1 manganese/zinc/iron transport system permease protein [Paenibacillus sp. PvP091]MBP1170269.1 manganese/zinc/iron transport system permease protein [Paenibacillus sp. PvR098]MBP2441297.1 manganese/zinc/iron transport system permease protein [Paenibacillus sp. PvP052]